MFNFRKTAKQKFDQAVAASDFKKATEIMDTEWDKVKKILSKLMYVKED